MLNNLFPTDDLLKQETPVSTKQPLKETPKIKDFDPLEGVTPNQTSPFQGSTTAGGEGFFQASDSHNLQTIGKRKKLDTKNQTTK